jgi:hypothetical protein
VIKAPLSFCAQFWLMTGPSRPNSHCIRRTRTGQRRLI